MVLISQLKLNLKILDSQALRLDISIAESYAVNQMITQSERRVQLSDSPKVKQNSDELPCWTSP